MPQPDRYFWHLLDARAIWVKELAGALAKQVRLLGWIPKIAWHGYFQNQERSRQNVNPALDLRDFPLQRGFARWPMRSLLPESRRIARRLLGQSNDPKNTVLLCASPQYAPVARQWPGPVIYYMSDLYYAWGDNPKYINYYDRMMTQRADLVCPVSLRGKEYLLRETDCPEHKIAISPMATRQENILREPLLIPQPAPPEIADLPRPLIGVIGNLAANTDWLFLQQVIALLPGCSWVLVGSIGMPVDDAGQRPARQKITQIGGRVRFTGAKPYHELAAYARSFDIALLPYRKREPTYSGSSTRFYEHLAACRPMFATRGFHELLSKEPLVHLVDSATDFVARVKRLATQNFQDGVEEQRWLASKMETWEQRAQKMIADLDIRLQRAV